MDVLLRECGKHRVLRQGTDVLDVTLNQDLTADECVQLLVARNEFTLGLPYFLVVCRLGAFERISMAAGRVLADAPDHRPQGIVFVDAGFRARTVAGMVIRSAGLFVRHRPLFHFSSTEDDAQMWLEKARQQLCAETQRPSSGA